MSIEPAAWVEQARQLIEQAKSRGEAVDIQGHGSKAFYGNPLSRSTVPLSTLDYQGVVSYDPTELVVVVRAGTPIEVLQSVLAENNQMLAFDPPQFSGPRGRGTVGGMVATGLSGPRRLQAGACRDFILGLTVLSADGQLLRYGGTVMKNVAGYDLSRLHAGALGSLGLILDVSLKVLPRPAAIATIRLPVQEPQAILMANQSLAQPLPIVATAYLPQSAELLMELAGAQAAVASAQKRFADQHGAQSLAGPEAEAFWTSLRDQTHAVFRPPSDAHSLWRISVPTTSPVLSQQTCLSEWAFGQRWVWSELPAQVLFDEAARLGGHATAWRAAVSSRLPQTGVFARLAPVVQQIHLRLKEELDSQRLFNPGRLGPQL
ncbi:MAG: glycolate oxidase subunit GlcE [Burkholderiaceae bacterium]